MTRAIWRSFVQLERQEQEVLDKEKRWEAYKHATFEAYEKARERHEKIKAVTQRNLDKIRAKQEELNILTGSKKGRRAEEINRMMAPVGMELELEDLDDPTDDSPDAPFEFTLRPAIKRKKSTAKNKKQPNTKEAVTATISRPSRSKHMFESKDVWDGVDGRSSVVSATDSESESDGHVSKKRRRRSLSEHSNITLAPAATTRLTSQALAELTSSSNESRPSTVSSNLVDLTNVQSVASSSSDGTNLVVPEHKFDSSHGDGEGKYIQNDIEPEGYAQPDKPNAGPDDMDYSSLFGEDEALPTTESWDQQGNQHGTDTAAGSSFDDRRSRSSSSGLFVSERSPTRSRSLSIAATFPALPRNQSSRPERAKITSVDVGGSILASVLQKSKKE